MTEQPEDQTNNEEQAPAEDEPQPEAEATPEPEAASESDAEAAEPAADSSEEATSDAGDEADAALAAAQAAVAAATGGEMPEPTDESDAALSAAQAAVQEAMAEAMAGGGADSAPDAQPFTPPAFDTPTGEGGPADLELLGDVQLNVKIELGRTRMLVEDVLKLNDGAVVELDKLAGDPVDVYVNERHVARGEVLVLNDNFCVRINEILDPTVERD